MTVLSPQFLEQSLDVTCCVVHMEYEYSTIVDPSAYETEGLCDGIPLRVHKYPDLEDMGSLRAQEDWTEHVGPVDNYRGGLGPKYSFMAVSVPECLPERLEIISYANEFAFLHDGELNATSFASSSILLIFCRCHRQCWQSGGSVTLSLVCRVVLTSIGRRGEQQDARRVT